MKPKPLAGLWVNEELFWSRVTKTDSCWLWDNPMPNGYGQFWIGRKRDRTRTRCAAHRVSYVLRHGEIPSGLTLDHLCRNPACVNPDHLEPVGVVENVMRGRGFGPANLEKTECPVGHPFDDENTYWYRGARQCRICRRERNREQYVKYRNDPEKWAHRLATMRAAYHQRASH